jgi:hypothetical protein
MLASELIKKLEELRDKYGDLPVQFHGPGSEDSDVGLVTMYDQNGREDDHERFKNPYQIYIHPL